MSLMIINLWVRRNNESKASMKAQLRTNFFCNRDLSEDWVKWLGKELSRINDARADEAANGRTPLLLDKESIALFLQEGIRSGPQSPLWLMTDEDWRQVWGIIAKVPEHTGRWKQNRTLMRQRIRELWETAARINFYREFGDAHVRKVFNHKPLTAQRLACEFPTLDLMGLPVDLQVQAVEWFRIIHGQFLIDLADPVQTQRKGPAERVGFLRTVIYEFHHTKKTVTCFVKNAMGEIYDTKGAADLVRPLPTDEWLHLYVKHWMRRIPAEFEAMDGWLQRSLELEFKRLEVIKDIRTLLVKTYPIDKGVKDIALRLRDSREAAVLNSRDYEMAWQNREVLQDYRKSAPRAMVAYRLIQQEEQLPPDADMAELKACLHKEGVNQTGWRLLLRHGVRLERICRKAKDNYRIDELIALLRILQGFVGREQPCEAVLVACLRHARAYQLIPQGFTRAAQAEYEKSTTTEQRDSMFRHDFPLILQWLWEADPTLDHNQQRASWRFWQTSAINWEVEKDKELENTCWDGILDPFVCSSFLVQPLTNAKELLMEGRAMRNCIADYADGCLEGEYLAFSLLDRDSRQRRALVGIYIEKESDILTVDEVKGLANRAATLEEEAVAQVIKKRCERYYAGKGLTIDNCKFEFQCPKSWDALRHDPAHDDVRHCNSCEKPVYLCRTDNDLAKHTACGHCVAIMLKKPETNVHNQQAHLVGYVTPQYHIPGTQLRWD
jgi:hypothetical protein